MLTFLSVVALLAINAFFVAAEFALVKARGVRIQQMASEGSRSARLTARIHGNLEPYLAACQLGITMASLGLGWVGEPAVAALLEPAFRLMGMSDAVLHTVAFFTGFLLFSSLHIVIGEQVPKTWAIRRAEHVSLLVAYPLRMAFLLAWPLNWALNLCSRKILHWLNVEEASHQEVFNDTELKDLVSTSHEHGVMESSKAAMLHNLLDFDQRNVAKIMIPRRAVAVLDLAADEVTNREVIAKSCHSRFPLIDTRQDGSLIGLVLAKELYLGALAGNDDIYNRLQDFARRPKVVPESQLIANLFDEMRSERVHLAGVVDEYGSFVGIVTMEDLLEEIVGEIEDEQDEMRGEPWVEAGSSGTWQVNGMTSLLDLEREIGFPLTNAPDINTIGGIVLNELQRFPEPGDQVTIHGFRITVLNLTGRRIAKVEIESAQDVESSTLIPDSDPQLPVTD